MFFSIVAANHFRIGLRGGGVTAGPAVTVSTVCRGGGGGTSIPRGNFDFYCLSITKYPLSVDPAFWTHRQTVLVTRWWLSPAHGPCLWEHWRRSLSAGDLTGKVNTAMFQESRVLKESNMNTETQPIMGSNDGGEHS